MILRSGWRYSAGICSALSTLRMPLRSPHITLREMLMVSISLDSVACRYATRLDWSFLGGGNMEEDRRAFLKGAGATLAMVGAASPAAAQAPAAPNDAPPVAAAGSQSLRLVEAAPTEALVDPMWPPAALPASGVDLGIATYIYRQLAGPFRRHD